MRPSEIFRAVFLGLAANKFRVFLTSLGIIIGAFTIIMVVGIGKAGEAAVSAQFSRLSVESITIARTRGIGSAMTSTANLSRDDAVRMVDELDHVKAIGVSTRTTSDISAGMVSASISILGIDENYALITNLRPLYGSLFTDEDSRMRVRVVVLGYNIASDLFEGNPKSDVGITGPSAGGVGSPDDMAYIPYDVAVKPPIYAIKKSALFFKSST